jgi:hypothetical protein
MPGAMPTANSLKLRLEFAIEPKDIKQTHANGCGAIVSGIATRKELKTNFIVHVEKPGRVYNLGIVVF